MAPSSLHGGFTLIPPQKSKIIDTNNGHSLKDSTFSKPSIWASRWLLGGAPLLVAEVTKIETVGEEYVLGVSGWLGRTFFMPGWGYYECGKDVGVIRCISIYICNYVYDLISMYIYICICICIYSCYYTGAK